MSPTLCIHAFRRIFTRNKDYFLKQRKPVCYRYGDAACFLWGGKWTFVCYSDRALDSDSSAWRQAAQRSPLFQFALSLDSVCFILMNCSLNASGGGFKFMLSIEILGSWVSDFVSITVPRKLLYWDWRSKVRPVYPHCRANVKEGLVDHCSCMCAFINVGIKVRSLVECTDSSEVPAASVLRVVLIHPDDGGISFRRKPHISQSR